MGNPPVDGIPNLKPGGVHKPSSPSSSSAETQPWACRGPPDRPPQTKRKLPPHPPWIPSERICGYGWCQQWRRRSSRSWDDECARAGTPGAAAGPTTAPRRAPSSLRALSLCLSVTHTQTQSRCRGLEDAATLDEERCLLPPVAANLTRRNRTRGRSDPLPRPVS